MSFTPNKRFHRGSAVALVMVCLAVGFAMRAHGRVSAPSNPDPSEAARRWGVPDFLILEDKQPIEPSWSRRLVGYLPTRDGVPLRYSVLLPNGAGPFPVVINYSGYDPGAIGGYSYMRNDSAMSTQIDRSLLERGYAVMGVNARGTGCSEGVFDFLGPAYGTDGADAVEWAAMQSWSTGSIGMANWSWAGMSQIATASERPPHLKAIAPGMALTDPRSDSWAIGGVPSQGFVSGWWVFLHSRWLSVRRSAEVEHDARCLAQAERNFASGKTAAVNLPSQLIRHPLRDAWIERRTLLHKAGQIEVPVLSMEAFQDEATTVRAGYYHELLDPSRLWLIATNGNHDLYESLQFRPTLLSFFDHFLKGANNGFDQRPHVEIWQETVSVPGTVSHAKDEHAKASWVIHRQSLPVPVREIGLALQSDHRLSFDDGALTATEGAESDRYDYPVEGPTVNVEWNKSTWGALSPAWKSGSAVYTSAPLPRSMVIYGPASADLWISSTQSDTDVQVTLTEVRPDLQERFVQRGWLRLSNRALDPTRSTATRPWSCDRPDCLEALSPEVPVLGRVELAKVSHAFRAGSRIRIWIDAPSATGSNSFDHSSLPSTNTIWHDATHPSRLVLGELVDVKVPAESPVCDQVLMQPCRVDPLSTKEPAR